MHEQSCALTKKSVERVTLAFIRGSTSPTIEHLIPVVFETVEKVILHLLCADLRNTRAGAVV